LPSRTTSLTSAEHEQIAGDRAREAGDIVGISDHQPAGEAFCKMRRRILLADGVADPPRQFRVKGYALFAGELDKAGGEIRVICIKRGCDIPHDHSLVIPQSRIELDVGEFGGIILCRQNSAGVPRMRPQQQARRRAHRSTCQSRADLPPSHRKTLIDPKIPAFRRIEDGTSHF
jgi:hypothetical protein